MLEEKGKEENSTSFKIKALNLKHFVKKNFIKLLPSYIYLSFGSSFSINAASRTRKEWSVWKGKRNGSS